jgi:uncharacterized repeat protein (TIGR03803 family)
MRPLSILVTFSILSLGAFAGCSQQTVSSPASNGQLTTQREPAVEPFKLIYSFKGSPDGAAPVAGLTSSPTVSGALYGSTKTGGTKGNGTVFVVDADTGKEGVLHAFTGPDGSDPESDLTLLNGPLYGTTVAGGANNDGTVYEIKPDGTERVVHDFAGMDGKTPSADLTADLTNGVLYGTALSGGAFGGGVVFAVRPKDGTEHTIHDFRSTPDGAKPLSALTLLDGAYYGTTVLGGANDIGCVFEVHPNGTEKVVYDFKGAGRNDGADPEAGLAVLNGVLYGVTRVGGANNKGTIFEVHKDGTERVIYSFKGSDGMDPRASLTVFKGLLYGTTTRGGTLDFGTVFEVHPDGTLRVLHSFSESDGRGPRASLTDYTNALYGTTSLGGANKLGTVFEVVLPLPRTPPDT